MLFVIQNKDSLAEWAKVLFSVFIVTQVLGTVLNVLMAILLPIAGAILAVVGVLGLLGITISGPVLLAVGLLIAGAAALAIAFATNFGGIRDTVMAFVAMAAAYIQMAIESLDSLGTFVLGLPVAFRTAFDRAVTIARTTLQLIPLVVKAKIEEAVKAVKANVDKFVNAGKSLMDGLVRGIKNGIAGVVAAIVSAVQQAIKAAQNAADMFSPSRVFIKFGQWMMEGLAIGLEKFAPLATGAMTNAMSGVVAAGAAPAVTNTNNYSTVNNLSLTVNSSARKEPIIQDFQMLRSMV